MRVLLRILLLLFISETLEAQNGRAIRPRTPDRIENNRSLPELRTNRPENPSNRQRRFLENNPQNENLTSHNQLNNSTLARTNQEILVGYTRRNGLTPGQMELATKLNEALSFGEHDFTSAAIRALGRLTDPKEISYLTKILDKAKNNLSITNDNYSQAMNLALFRSKYRQDQRGNWCI